MSKEEETADVLIRGGLVLAMDDAGSIYRDGAVAVRGSQILAVGPAQEISARFRSDTVLDARGQVVLPGLVNAHTHAPMTLFRGLSDDIALEPWLERIWALEKRYATAENVAAGAELAFAEMIRSGTTTAADMYWQRDAVMETARKAGFRLVNGPSFIDFVGPDGIQLEQRLPLAREFIEKYRDDPLVSVCVQVHTTYTVPPPVLEMARDLAREYGLLFITHAAESRGEMAAVRERYGKTPIEVLDEAGLLGGQTLLAHCVHLSDDEIALLAERRTAVAHCPESNLKIGSGIARIPDFLKAGVTVGLGTDGAASNNDLDLWGEMRTAALIQKGLRYDPTVMPAPVVLRMATIEGARALGLGQVTGSLEAGKRADLISIDLDRLHLTPLFDIYSHLVYAAKSADVRNVMIDGRMVMQDGALLTIDEGGIKERVRRIAEKFAGT
jgi:5-methylthioadenosine/S-adenosylhomocysteine deaminase